jgi:hypothetical protein
MKYNFIRIMIFESGQHIDCLHKSKVVVFKSKKVDVVGHQICAILDTSLVIETLKYFWNYLTYCS